MLAFTVAGTDCHFFTSCMLMPHSTCTQVFGKPSSSSTHMCPALVPPGWQILTQYWSQHALSHRRTPFLSYKVPSLFDLTCQAAGKDNTKNLKQAKQEHVTQGFFFLFYKGGARRLKEFLWESRKGKGVCMVGVRVGEGLGVIRYGGGYLWMTFKTLFRTIFNDVH